MFAVTSRSYAAFATAFAVAFLFLMSVSSVSADVAPAGSFIGNQGSLTFTDGEGDERTITSNVVQIEVLPVSAVSLEADQTKPAASGGEVTFTHSLTNTGNDDDIFDLLATDLGGDFNFDSIQIFADDGSGNPTGPALTATPELEPGETFNFVIVATLPGGLTDDQTADLSITATSNNDPDVSSTNTDTAVVTGDAIIEVNKALSNDAADPGTGPHTITLTITNTGGGTASNISLNDLLDPVFAYVDESGSYEGTGTTDAADGVEASSGVDYQHNDGTGEVTLVIASLADGETRVLEFDFTVPADAAAGDAENSVDVSYDDGSGTIVNDTSNTVTFSVNAVASPDANDQSPDGNTTSGTDDGAVNDNVVEEDSAGQGDAVDFENIITNSGNATDTFDISLSGSTFPANSTFQLLNANGTPMLDSNGNSTADTGPLEPGESFIVLLRVVLPPDAAGNNGGAGFEVVKTATSTIDPAVTESVTDRLNEIVAASVDLTDSVSVNDGAQPGGSDVGGNGAGAGPESAPVNSVTTNPGEPATFNIHVNNTGGNDDSYALSTPVLPDGFTVTYYLDAGIIGEKDDGDILLNGTTGNVPAGESVLIFAEVGTPSDQDAGDYQVNIAATSSSTGASDEIHEQVSIAELHDVTIAPPSNSGTAVAGGTVTYPHVITNNGNLPEDVVLTTTNSDPGYDSTVFIDSNNNGIVDAGDIEIPAGGSIPLEPGEQANILVQVTAPLDAESGDQNVTTVTGTYNDGNDGFTATENTEISAGDVSYDKDQALDAECDGVADGAFAQTNVSAAPGQCVVYRLTATNNSPDIVVTDLTMRDTTPAFTSYEDCGGACAASATTGTVTAPADGSSGDVNNSFAALPPAGVEVLTFTVRLNDE